MQTHDSDKPFVLYCAVCDCRPITVVNLSFCFVCVVCDWRHMTVINPFLCYVLLKTHMTVTNILFCCVWCALLHIHDNDKHFVLLCASSRDHRHGKYTLPLTKSSVLFFFKWKLLWIVYSVFSDMLRLHMYFYLVKYWYIWGPGVA